MVWSLLQNGAPDKIRTCDPQIRNLVLYPTELRARAVVMAHSLQHCWPAGQFVIMLKSWKPFDVRIGIFEFISVIVAWTNFWILEKNYQTIDVTFHPVRLANHEVIDTFRCIPVTEKPDGTRTADKLLLVHDKDVMGTASKILKFSVRLFTHCKRASMPAIDTAWSFPLIPIRWRQMKVQPW